MKRIHKYLMMFLAVTVLACSDDAPRSPMPLAMEAWIDSGDYPVVILTRALAPGVEETAVSEALVRWGKVTISDGTDTVVMTGGVDGTVFPPYSYRSYAMRGRVGAEYTITAEYEGERIVARARIPSAPKIKSLEFRRVDGGSGAYSGHMTFESATPADTCMYVVYTRVRNSESRHYPAFMGTVTTLPGTAECEVPVYRGRHEDAGGAFTPNFVAGDTVDVILAHVEPQVYRFWDDYQNEVYFRDNIFVTSTGTVRGNVHGGYGIFSARGTARRIAVVGE